MLMNKEVKVDLGDAPFPNCAKPKTRVPRERAGKFMNPSCNNNTEENGGKSKTNNKMAPPSALTIATSSVHRLMKEEASYHKELKGQEARLEKLLASKSEDENAEYQIKQERTAIEETKAVFPPLTERLEDALHKLEDKLEAEKTNGASAEEVTKAESVIADAKKVIADAKAAAASK